MNKAIELNDLTKWFKLLEISHQHPILLFKFSPICPISHYAELEFESYLNECPNELKVFTVNVITSRNISKQVAADVEVEHQSPQALFISMEKCLWHESHSAITKEALLSNIKFGV